MDKNTDIQYIRRLVEKFYQGETSPAEEGILAEYFTETNKHDIPDDLAKEAEVFSCMNSLLPNVDEIKIPENLESQLVEITNVVPEKEVGRKFRIAPFILKAAAIAAAACLILGMLTFIPRWAGFQPAYQSELTAEANIEDADKMPALIDKAPKTIVEEKTEKEATKADKKTLVKKSSRHHLTQSKTKTQNQLSTVTIDLVAGSQEDGFIEITDPEEAHKIMENIGNLLAANFSESSKAMNTVSASIESYKEITKTILQ